MMPVLVNTKVVAKGVELVVLWKSKAVQRQTKKAKVIRCHEQAARAAKKA